MRVLILAAAAAMVTFHGKLKAHPVPQKAPPPNFEIIQDAAFTPDPIQRLLRNQDTRLRTVRSPPDH